MVRMLIYGAGEAGRMVLAELKNHRENGLRVAGFIDDDPSKRGEIVDGTPVLGGLATLNRAISAHSIGEVIIAMPSIPKNVVRPIVRACIARRVKLLIVPSTREIIEGRVRFNQIKSIDPADLLDRERPDVETGRIREYVEGRDVLVTGAAGSIGAILVEKLFHYAPRTILALDLNENGLFYLQRRVDGDGSPGLTRFVPLVSDVKNLPMMRDLFDTYRPDVLFHAAAYKHVPLMERNVKMIYLNNVVGTQNLVALSREGGVERFIGISTDKAVYPVSIMGMTKRICELLYKSAAVEGLKIGAVRFGNVLGSNGSVMTVFRRQIRQGGPLTITSPDMERYFMTIDEATGLVLQAGSMEGRGDVLVLDMGEPIRIQDLAENLIILSGMTPGEDIEIRYTGVREGEKLSEELFHRESFRRKTSCPNITREVVEVDGTLSDRLASIRRDFDAMSEEEMRHAIEDLIGGRKADCVPL